jgi:hypothetical protein
MLAMISCELFRSDSLPDQRYHSALPPRLRGRAMSDLQTEIERLNRLAKTVSDSELRIRCLARELRVLAERVREKEQAMAAAGLFCYVSHIRRTAHRRGMDRQSVARARCPDAPRISLFQTDAFGRGLEP